MRTILLAIVLFGTLPAVATAQQLRDVAPNILGGVLNEMQRQQQLEHQRRQQQQQRKKERQLQRQLSTLWDACAKGELESCDTALEYPMSDNNRQSLLRMRNIVADKPALEAAWQECFQNSVVSSCDRALQLNGLSQEGRRKAIQQRQAILAEDERRRRLEAEARSEQRRLEAEQSRREAQERREREQNAAAEATARQRAAAFTQAKAQCETRNEDACHKALALASNSAEMIRTVALLERAQAPFGIPALKALATVPASSWITGGLAAAVLALSLLYAIARRRSMNAASQTNVVPGPHTTRPPSLDLTSGVVATQSLGLIEGHIAPTPPSLQTRETVQCTASESPTQARLVIHAHDVAQPPPRVSEQSPSNAAPSHKTVKIQNQSTYGIRVSPHSQQRGAITRALIHPVGYVLFYIFGMAPTYILPYLGSNSTALNTIGVAAGVGPNPMFWLHLLAILFLCFLAWMAGSSRGKGWIVVFPVLAGAFDLVPGLNFVPLVPTVMHLIAIVLCVASPQLSSQQNFAP